MAFFGRILSIPYKYLIGILFVLNAFDVGITFFMLENSPFVIESNAFVVNMWNQIGYIPSIIIKMSLVLFMYFVVYAGQKYCRAEEKQLALKISNLLLIGLSVFYSIVASINLNVYSMAFGSG